MRFVRTSVSFALAVAVTLVSGTVLFAQSTDNDAQTFTVVVGDAIDISAPIGVSANHPLTDVDIPFAQQTWNVYTSNVTGAGVVMQMGRFVNTSNGSYFRDGQLDLAILSSDSTASWIPGASVSDTTTLSGVATVDCSSSGPGSGGLGVSVTFLTGDASTMASGDYVATVTGVITNNP